MLIIPAKWCCCDCFESLIFRLSLSQLPRITDHNLNHRFSRFTPNLFNSRHNIHPRNDLPEHDVLPIQPTRFGRAEEKLGAIGVGSGIRHGQDTRPGVFELEVFIGKFLSVNGLPACSVSSCEVTTLAHETGDCTQQRQVSSAIRIFCFRKSKV